MWPFKKRKPESPQEIAAEQKLDEATREVAWAEFDEKDATGRPQLDSPLPRAGSVALTREAALARELTGGETRPVSGAD
jgi:hypothetical protein